MPTNSGVSQRPSAMSRRHERHLQASPGWHSVAVPVDVSRPTGALRPIELATASVLAALAVVLTVAGWFLPHLGVIAALAVVPLGVVAHRHRLRALLVATFSASILCFLVAGTGAVTNIIECAAVGGLVGVAKRRGWHPAALFAGTAVIGPALGLASVAILAVLGSLRKLTILQIRNTWIGVRRILSLGIPQSGVISSLNHFVDTALRLWWVTVFAIVVLATVWLSLVAWLLLGPVLERLAWISAEDRLHEPGPHPADPPPVGTGDPAPVPAFLEDVSYAYPGAEDCAVLGVSLAVAHGQMVALVGDNGSGKSTLIRLLAGRRPTGGVVRRQGPVGLGRPGGTALIMQHPETQVLGVRVEDDVVWGLTDTAGVDVAGLLATVGLAGMGGRETSGLSGGELQRLAVAASMARQPALLLSDESTAMLDEQGRRSLSNVLRSLPGRSGTTVVHVTHRLEEAELADEIHRMRAGRLVASENAAARRREGADTRLANGRDVAEGDSLGLADGPRGARRPDACHPGARHPDGPRVVPSGAAQLRVVDVSHTYSLGTPWANQALSHVNLKIDAGEGVLVVGDNGSGKSTLAWVLAGLLRPSRGDVYLGDRPVLGQVGSVAVAFQHARLQLQRSTAGADIRAAGGCDDASARAALSAVGLNPSEFFERRVDALSGGQQRRVALAGLLASRPSVLVLDEPFAGLDAAGRDGIADLLGVLCHERGVTVVIISHDMEGTERIAGRVVRLESGRIHSDVPRGMLRR